MKTRLGYALMIAFTFSFYGVQAQWNPTGNNLSTGSLTIGSGDSYSYSQLMIKGPNTPYGLSSKRDITFSFKVAGQATVRSYRGYAWDTYLQFLTSDYSNKGGTPSVRMHIEGNGNIGIGTTTPGSYKLAVEGKIGAREIQVKTGTWADYVFEEDYNLADLNEVEKYIKKNKHLPGIPTATEVEKDGINLGEMNVKLLEKVEELTLYLIEMKKENEELKMRVEKLEGQDHE